MAEVVENRITKLLSNKLLSRVERMRLFTSRRFTNRSRGEHVARGGGNSRGYRQVQRPGNDAFTRGHWHPGGQGHGGGHLHADQEERTGTDRAALERRERRPDDEESRARREEFVNRMRNGMLDRWDREWETATPESKERITAIANYEQELMDIRGGIRSAQTDEERLIIIEEMSTTREAMNQTMKDEQNAQLSNLAVKYGVSDPEKIDQFVLDTQKTLNSPIFQGGRGGGGGFSFGGPEVEVSAGQR